jgi:trigger factor
MRATADALLQLNMVVAKALSLGAAEDKVVDFLFDAADVTERAVTKDELQAAIEAEELPAGGHVHGPDCNHDHDHVAEAAPAKPKKAAAKKKVSAAAAPADAPAAEAEPAPAAPKKKPAAKKKAASADEAA